MAMAQGTQSQLKNNADRFERYLELEAQKAPLDKRQKDINEEMRQAREQRIRIPNEVTQESRNISNQIWRLQNEQGILAKQILIDLVKECTEKDMTVAEMAKVISSSFLGI